MRPLALGLCLLMGCVEPDADVLAEDGLAEPIPAMQTPVPDRPAAGWVRVEGPVELAQLDTRPERAPATMDLAVARSDPNALSLALCESPGDDVRDRTAELATGVSTLTGELGLAEPGICYGPAWCSWAFQRVRPEPESELEGVLEARLSRCQHRDIRAWLDSRGPISAANRSLYDVSADKALTAPVLDEIIARIQAGEEIHLAIVLVDAWGQFDEDAIRTQLLEARNASLDTGVRDSLGRGLGVFAHPDARRAWERSCRDASIYSCEAKNELPLIPAEDMGLRLRQMAERTGRYGLRPILAKAALDGLPDVRVSDGLIECASGAGDGHTAEVCLEAMLERFPGDAERAVSALLTRKRPHWPSLRRRLLAAQAGADGTFDALVQAGLLVREDGRPTRRTGTDPVHILADMGRATPVYQSDAPLGRLEVLRRMFFLAGVPAVVDLPESDPYRPVAWVDGTRYETTLNRTAAPDNVNAAGLAAFVNAVVAARGGEQRLLVQPQHSRYVQSHVVVGTIPALQAGIETGLLTDPVPDQAAWARARARWATESIPQVEAEESWDTGG